jgi:hypothetical protein
VSRSSCPGDLFLLRDSLGVLLDADRLSRLENPVEKKAGGLGAYDIVDRGPGLSRGDRDLEDRAARGELARI